MPSTPAELVIDFQKKLDFSTVVVNPKAFLHIGIDIYLIVSIFVSRLKACPLKYPIYAGTNGNTQGDRNEISPARMAMK